MFAMTIAPTTSEMPLMKARRAKAPAEMDRQTTWIASAVTKETGSGADGAVLPEGPEDGPRLVHRGRDPLDAPLRLDVDRDVPPGAPGLRERLAGDVDDVVLALAEDGALLDEEPDDAERDPVDRDRPADRVEAREELVAHLRADDRDEGAALVLGLGEEAPEVDVEVRELGDVRRHARDLDVGEASCCPTSRSGSSPSGRRP